MPFGLAIAPRVFTKLMVVIGQYLWLRQVHIYMYMDDWLIKNQHRHLLVHQREILLNLLHSLGLIVNWQKSQLIPTQEIDYLKAVWQRERVSIRREVSESFTRNCTVPKINMGTSTQKSQAFGLNDSMYRFGPISSLAYAAYPILFPVFMAATQKKFVCPDTHQDLVIYLDGGPTERIYSEDLSIPGRACSSMDRCIRDWLGSPYGHTSNCKGSGMCLNRPII